MNKLLVLILLFIFSCKQRININYYLPSNFEGEVAIIYNIKDGITPTFKDGRLEIMVPDSGIVLLNTEYKPGEIDYRYYTKAGDRYYRLYPNDFSTETDSNKKRIFLQRVMTFDFPYKRRTEDSVSYVGELFHVGKRLDTTAEKNRFLFEQHVSEILHSKK